MHFNRFKFFFLNPLIGTIVFEYWGQIDKRPIKRILLYLINIFNLFFSFVINEILTLKKNCLLAKNFNYLDFILVFS